MAGDALLLGLDVGTTRAKAVLLDVRGVEVATSVVATPLRTTAQGVDMEVDALGRALARLLGALGDDLGRVAGVGVTGMAESGAPLDAQGRPLAPVIAWYDPRGSDVVAALDERFGDEIPRRIGQRLRTVSSLAKLGWLLGEGVVGVHRWLGVPELCLFALTNAEATDPSLAARSGCYDIVERSWWPEPAAAIGVDVAVFAPVHRAGAVLGRVSASGASWSGLGVGVPVALAGHDHLAAFVGSGARPGDAGNSVGTAETVVLTTDMLPDLEEALAQRVAVTLQPEGNGWALLSGAARAGRVVEAVSHALGRSPADLDAQAQVQAEAEAPSRTGGGPGGHDGGGADGGGGGRGAAMVAAVVEGRVPDVAWGSPAEVWRATLGALAERTWEALGRARALVGPSDRLVVFGGGSRSVPWLRAKVVAGAGEGTAVWRSNASEAAARGAALQAGVAAGWWSSAAEAPSPGLEVVDPAAFFRL